MDYKIKHENSWNLFLTKEKTDNLNHITFSTTFEKASNPEEKVKVFECFLTDSELKNLKDLL